MTCPLNPAHGRVFDLATDVWFCSHSDHYRDNTKRLFTDAEVFAGHELRQTTAPKAKRTRKAAR